MGRTVLLTTVFLAASTAAVAAPPDGSSLSERRVYYADQAIDAAGKQVQHAYPACRARRQPSSASTRAPSAVFQQTLTALRRPAAPSESGHPGIPQSYAGWARVLPLTSSTSVTIYPIYDMNPFRPRPRRCAAALSRRVSRAVGNRSRAFKRVVRRELAVEVDRVWTSSPREGLFAAVDGGGGPVVPLKTLRGHGLELTRTSLDASGVIVFELVPDGVSRVDASFDGYRTSGTVTGNVVSYHLPPGSAGAGLTRQVWRNGAGDVILEISGG